MRDFLLQRYKPIFFSPSLTLILICLIIFGFSSGLESPLAYQRQAIDNGELWRLVTANFIHLNIQHLILNLLGLALAWWVIGSTNKLSEQWLITGTVILLTLPLLFFSVSTIKGYVGMSGVIHGLIVGWSLVSAKRQTKLALVVLALVVLKLAGELFFETEKSVAHLIDATVIIESHLIGAICGLVAGTAFWIVRRKSM